MPEKNIDGEEPMMAHHATCRGCAGTGLRHDFPTRLVQAAQQPIQIPAWTDPVTGRHKSRVIPGVGQTAPYNPGTGAHRITDTRWSLTDCLYTAEMLRGIGADVPEPVYTHEDKCPWCHGTGKPQLSTHTLEIGAGA